MADTRSGSGSPTVLRMILGRQLQALREKAGMTYEQAAEAIYSSEWTIRRMERAEGGLKPLTVKSLLMAYGVTDVRRDRRLPGPGPRRQQARLVAQLRRRPAGLVPHRRRPGGGRHPDPRLRAAGRPRAAANPGLRPGHHRRQLPRRHRAKRSQRRVALRLARQQLLTRPGPPGYWVVLDETVLRRPVGRPEGHARPARRT